LVAQTCGQQMSVVNMQNAFFGLRTDSAFSICSKQFFHQASIVVQVVHAIECNVGGFWRQDARCDCILMHCGGKKALARSLFADDQCVQTLSGIDDRSFGKLYRMSETPTDPCDIFKALFLAEVISIGDRIQDRPAVRFYHTPLSDERVQNTAHVGAQNIQRCRKILRGYPTLFVGRSVQF
jgi:hypothetical protein